MVASKEWTKNLLSTIQNMITPMGTVISYMGNTAPNGYLSCDGATYDIADYQKFANFIKDQFGTYNYFGGNGTTTFAVPDLRGEFLRGTGTNSYTDCGSGVEVGKHQNPTQIPQISAWNNSATQGIITIEISNPAASTSGNVQINGDTGISSRPNARTYRSTSALTNISTNETVKDKYTTRPTNTSVLYCIKVQ